MRRKPLRISGGDYGVFLASPICVVIAALIVLSIAYPIWKIICKRRTAGDKAQNVESAG